IDEVIDAVVLSCQDFVQREIDASVKTFMLRNRLETDRDGESKTVVLQFRHYLRLLSVPHRKVFTRFILSDHNLAVEVLRHGHRWYEFPHGYRRWDIPREWRLCRFCQMNVEDEVHATLVYTSN
ncbi:hypothetical protein C8J57DRAFT_983450, partial [Mycena rebaudengoi]